MGNDNLETGEVGASNTGAQKKAQSKGGRSDARESQPQSRRDSILDTALELLTTQGHGRLSMDKIATAVGISKGNLTYHFATKQDLIDAMFHRLIQKTRGMRLDPPLVFSEDPMTRLSQKIDLELNIMQQRGYDVRAWEAYAYGAHDKNVQAMLTGVINWYVNYLAEAIKEARPDLSSGGSQECATVLVALFRGMMLFIGASRPANNARDALVARTRMTALRLVGAVDHHPDPAVGQAVTGE